MTEEGMRSVFNDIMLASFFLFLFSIFIFNFIFMILCLHLYAASSKLLIVTPGQSDLPNLLLIWSRKCLDALSCNPNQLLSTPLLIRPIA